MSDNDDFTDAGPHHDPITGIVIAAGVVIAMIFVIVGTGWLAECLTN